MKFLLFTLEYLPFKGGVANYYTNLVYYWPKFSDILVLNNKKFGKKRYLIKFIFDFFGFYSYVKKNKINHILVGHILPLGTIVFLLSKIYKIEYTVFLHGLDFSLATRNSWKRFLSKKILRRANKIVCANSRVFEMLNTFLGDNKKSIVVNPGAKDFNFNLEENKDFLINKYNLKDKKILFSLGRLVKRKGFDNVIRSLKYLNYNNLLYIISGDGPDKLYLQKIAEKELGLNWQNKIIFTGEISELDKWTFFALSDFFVMPSRSIYGDYEGFGIVYLEANLAEKAVIAGNAGGVGDAVIDGLNGLLVNPESPEDLSDAIKKLLNDEELRDKLAYQGRNRALNDFDWKNQVNKIYEFLSK